MYAFMVLLLYLPKDIITEIFYFGKGIMGFVGRYARQRIKANDFCSLFLANISRNASILIAIHIGRNIYKFGSALYPKNVFNFQTNFLLIPDRNHFPFKMVRES